MKSFTRCRKASFKVRAAKEDGGDVVLEGYAVRWGEKADLFGQTESFRAGAFSATLADNEGVRFLAEHQGLPMAAAPDTMRLAEDDVGLRFEVSLSPANPRAKEVIVEAQRGTLRNVSVGFQMGEGSESRLTFDESSDTYHEEIVRVGRLREISAVTFPAYDGASLQPVTRGEKMAEPKEGKVDREDVKTGEVKASESNPYDESNPRFQAALRKLGYVRMEDDDREEEDREGVPDELKAEPEDDMDREGVPDELKAEPEDDREDDMDREDDVDREGEPEPRADGEPEVQRSRRVPGTEGMMAVLSDPNVSRETKAVIKSMSARTEAVYDRLEQGGS